MVSSQGPPVSHISSLRRMMCVCGCLPSEASRRQTGGLAVVLGPGKGPSSEMAAHLPDDQVGLGSKMEASGPFFY